MNKKESVSLLLPAYNEEAGIEKSLFNVKKGIDEFPMYDFTLYPVDDGSTDKTYEAILYWGNVYELKVHPLQNTTNIGVAQSLKKALNYLTIIGDDVIIKTDLDSDFDQSVVLEKLVPHIATKEPIVAGVRWREITVEENAHEVERRDDMLRILKQELGIVDIDPPSIGSQLYRKQHLRKLLDHPMVKKYDKRWGFELLLDLVSAKLGQIPPVIKIEKGSYDPLRRPKEKVDAQNNAYIETIAELVGKSPEQLSKFYNK